MAAQWKRTLATLSLAALLCLGAYPAFAHDHDHSHAADGTAQLTLNNGQKWATDHHLRQGMTHIRDALTAELPAIESGKATANQYRALAQKTHEQIAFMVRNCRLAPEADAMLHIILADIIAGADAMTGTDNNQVREGAEKIVHVLGNYGTYFNHPGWREVKLAH